MASDQIDLGFPKVIPPARALVKAHPRARPRASAREHAPPIIDVKVVEPVTNHTDAVADTVVAVERVTAQVPNAIEVPPASAQPPTPAPPAPPPTPTTSQPQRTEVITEKMSAFGAYQHVSIVEYDDRSYRSIQVKRGAAGLSWKKARWVVVFVALAAAGGAGLKWGPWVKAAFSPPPVVKPRLKSDPYGPPVPQHLLRRRQTKRPAPPPPSLLEQIFGK